MTPETIEKLNTINRQFYETTATDFDATRGRAWAGWVKLADYLSAPLSVLDVGCGNGRFGVFLAETLDGKVDYLGVDNNAKLLDFAKDSLAEFESVSATVQELDIVAQELPDDSYDLVVLFGVIHHVPGYDNRENFVAELAKRVKSGGKLVFAAWRFYEYERFKKRLVDWDDDINVEANDYLLDWRRGERALRYCHYVDDAELDKLVTATGLQEITRYRADGSDNAMNVYVVLGKE